MYREEAKKQVVPMAYVLYVSLCAISFSDYGSEG